MKKRVEKAERRAAAIERRKERDEDYDDDGSLADIKDEIDELEEEVKNKESQLQSAPSCDSLYTDDSEVEEIRNVCHGPQGESGPMGNRGYWGHNGTNGSNGTNGIDGSNGSIGISSFIQSHVGNYGSCPEAVIIEMGNNSSSKNVDSQIKICFQDLTRGRLSDIQPNSGNSFSTACNGGLSKGDLFVFAAVEDDKCLLFKMGNNTVQQISPTVDFSPGKILGFVEHQNRIWFDADDGNGVQMWSTDGHTTWKETNLSGGINICLLYTSPSPRDRG